MCEVIPDSVDNVDGLVAKLWKMTMLETTPYINVRFADWILSQHGGQLGANLVPSWSQVGTKNRTKSVPRAIQNAIIHQKCYRNPPKSVPRPSWRSLEAIFGLLDRFWTDFGWILDPSWSQVGSKIGPRGAKLGPRWSQVRPSWGEVRPTWILNQLGGQLGANLAQLGANLGPKWSQVGTKNPSKSVPRAIQNAIIF